MTPYITVKLKIGQTHGAAGIHYSLTQIREFLQACALPWTASPAVGSEGNAAMVEETTIAEFNWTDAFCPVDEFCRRVNQVVGSVFSVMHQNWVQVERIFVAGDETPKIALIHLNKDGKNELAVADLLPQEYPAKALRPVSRSSHPATGRPRRGAISISGEATRDMVAVASAVQAAGHSATVIVKVWGRDTAINRKVKGLSGVLVASKNDGYVRSLTIDSEDMRQVTIGGSNATEELIAASRVEFVIPDEAFDDIVSGDPVIEGYAPCETATDRDEVDRYLRMRQFAAAFVRAKRIGTAEVARAVKGFLGHLLPRAATEHLFAAFRAFAPQCKRSEKLATELTQALAVHVPKLATREDVGCSLVFGVEAMGYVAADYRVPGQIAATCLTQLLRNDCHRMADRDLIWATAVALDRVNFVTTEQVSTLKSACEDVTSFRGRVHVDHCVERMERRLGSMRV